jgi:hypothetical protein
MTPLISPAMSTHTTPGSAFQANMPHSNVNPSDFFSPLTSPALGPVQHYSSSYHQQPPSMSPHLLAQNYHHHQPHTSSSNNGGSNPSSYSNSPNEHFQPASPALNAPGGNGNADGNGNGGAARSRGRSSRGGPQSSVGPEAKVPRARPSPLIKPTNGPSSSRRSHPGQKRSSISALISHSPLIHPMADCSTIISPTEQQLTSMFQSFTPSVANAPLNLDGSISGSNSSPSPVDLDRVQMPPPPIPSRSASSSSSGSAAIAPQTPATFLNLSRSTSSRSSALSSFANGSTTTSGHARDNPSSLASPYIGPTQDTVSYNTFAGSSSYYQQQQQEQLEPTMGFNKFEAAERGGRSRKGSMTNGGSTKNRNSSDAGMIQGSGMTSRVARTIPKDVNPLRPKPKNSSFDKASSSSSSSSTLPPPPSAPSTKTSHKLAEQKRRDSLKAGFDDLRLLLPAISVSAIDPDTGLPIPGALKPRLPSKSPLLDDSNPNRGVSKVALLRCSNERLKVLEGRVARRDWCVEILRREVRSLRERLGEGGIGYLEGEEWLWADCDGVELDDDGEEGEEDTVEAPKKVGGKKKVRFLTRPARSSIIR